MSHYQQKCHPTFQRGSSHGGGASSVTSSHGSPAHHGGSQTSHHGGSQTGHHGGSQTSHHGGSQTSNHGGSQTSHHGGSQTSHHGGSQSGHHGGSQTSRHGGSQTSHHGGSQSGHHGGSQTSRHGGSQTSHHGGHHKVHHGASSIHGGSGGKGMSFSKHSSVGHGCGYGSGHGGYSFDSHFSSYGGHSSQKKDGLLSVNEKETMQLLNDRLACYLEKVHSLEQENAQLERKICEWYENNAQAVLPDFSSYYSVIAELQCQISAATVENARIVLQIDNARLASDDFRNKFEMENRLRSNVESDVNSLRRVLEGLNMERNDLEMQVQGLQDELQQMRSNHEEEVNCLRAQLGARVNVEVNAAPSVNLNEVLSEIREQYENMMERNLREVESMFLARIEELSSQVVSGSEQLESVQTEVIELKRCVQTLEIELQSQLSMKAALESTLAETEATYSSQLNQLQGMINNIESQLGQIRGDLERQIYEYKMLMDQKTHLEMEIATYKRLLEGLDMQFSHQHTQVSREASHSSMKHHMSSREGDHGKSVSFQDFAHQCK
ncbi:keratin, type I cytoskeletal 19-like [Ascaphus truei]|uniref:keratin, type I cytoskeletal 19-like n=1 Tax=Ascaphus truei TaxID=8439 RepID=UPI003F598D49